MKKLVLLLVFLLSFNLSLAVDCQDYLDSGEDYETFGYILYGDLVKSDECTSSTVLKEYYCDSSTSYDSVSYTCELGCAGGVCFSNTCENAFECNPELRMWCDETNTWQSSGYCDECGQYDSSCGESTCEEGACDYNSYSYCADDEWLTDYYCDVSNCGNHEYSLDQCVCVVTDETPSTEESCTDLIDNDCDGSIDCNDSDCADAAGCQCSDGDVQSCGDDTGACTIGEQTCVEGTWSACTGVEASEEICNDIDDDCDGEVDEECSCLPGEVRDCGENIGVCKAGVQTCEEDGTWSVCFGASYAASQIEDCNGLDDDCDGSIDEGCSCVGGSTQQCGSDVGACAVGLQTCEDGMWGECVGEVEPFPEVCGDLVDNDCDGYLDYDDDNCSVPDDEEDTSTDDDGSSSTSTTTTTEECVNDSDCDVEEVCSRGTCISASSSSTDVDAGTDSGTDSETDTTSLSSYGTDSNGDSGLGFLTVALVVILLVLGLALGSFFYLKKKGKFTIGKKPFKKSMSPRSSAPMQVRMNASSPVQTYTEKPKRHKSLLEKKLDSSFEKSKKLFGK